MHYDVRLIGAVADDMVAGATGRGMLWHAPEDLRHFRDLTTDTTVVMGRSTFQAMGGALKNRRNIVLTSRDPRAERTDLGVFWARSLEEAIQLHDSASPLFVIGGTRPWTEALALAHRIHLTKLELKVAGDVLFPEIDPAAWRISFARSAHILVDEHPTHAEFITYDRTRV